MKKTFSIYNTRPLFVGWLVILALSNALQFEMWIDFQILQSSKENFLQMSLRLIIQYFAAFHVLFIPLSLQVCLWRHHCGRSWNFDFVKTLKFRIGYLLKLVRQRAKLTCEIKFVCRLEHDFLYCYIWRFGLAQDTKRWSLI